MDQEYHNDTLRIVYVVRTVTSIDQHVRVTGPLDSGSWGACQSAFAVLSLATSPLRDHHVSRNISLKGVQSDSRTINDASMYTQGLWKRV